MTAARFAAALGNARREGHAWRCRCPLHRGRSLVLCNGDGGRVLITCWGGCDRRDVGAADEQSAPAQLGERRVHLARTKIGRLRKRVLEAINRKWPDLSFRDFWGGCVLAAALAQETEGNA